MSYDPSRLHCAAPAMNQELDAQVFGKKQQDNSDNVDVEADLAPSANALTPAVPFQPPDSQAPDLIDDDSLEEESIPPELEAKIEFAAATLAESSEFDVGDIFAEVDDASKDNASEDNASEDNALETLGDSLAAVEAVLDRAGPISAETDDVLKVADVPKAADPDLAAADGIVSEADDTAAPEPPTAEASPKIERHSCEEYIQKYYTGADVRYELVNGCLEPLSSSSFKELLLAQFLKKELDQAIEALEKPWQCLCEAGVRTGWRQVRLPHVYVIHSDQNEDMIDETMICQTPPSLVIEIVTQASGSMPYRHKRSEYAALGVSEYWIVDPIHEQVVVLVLEDGLYSETVYTQDTEIASPLFPKINLDSETLLASCALA